MLDVAPSQQGSDSLFARAGPLLSALYQPEEVPAFALALSALA